MQVYLIRHGETAWTKTNKHTGKTDLELTFNGRAQASELAQTLQQNSFSAVWVSPALRASQTCELAGLGGISRIEPDLAEWDYGDYEGLRSVDIRLKRPSWSVWTDGCPGGEAPDQVSARADRLIARLKSMSGTVALFTHGHFGSALAARWIGLPVLDGQHFQLGTASVSVLGFDEHRPEVAVIASWNTTPSGIRHRPDESRANHERATRRLPIERWENEGGEVIQGAGSRSLEEAK